MANLEHAAAGVDSIEVQVRKAAVLLAEQFASNVNRACGRRPDEDDENTTGARDSMREILERMPAGERIIMVMQTGTSIKGVVAGILAERDGCADLCRIVDLAREKNAAQVVAKIGAADAMSGAVLVAKRAEKQG